MVEFRFRLLQRTRDSLGLFVCICRDLTLRQCYLLRNTGGCSPSTFAAAIWARRDTDGCTAPTDRDNPLCVQLAPGRTDTRTITYDEAVSICRHGKGKARVAHPVNMLEVRQTRFLLHTNAHAH